MALSVLTPRSKYEPGEETPANLLLDELFGEEYERQFRPSISDRLHIRFLKTDHATQTIESEIPEIKSLTKTVQELAIEMENLTRDLHFAKQVITAKYRQDLENTAHQFHKKLQDRICDVERIHEDRVDVVRRSFKQQLQDALIQMASKYKKYYEDKLEGKFKPTTSTGDRKNKVTALEAEVQKCQSIIQMMEVQMEELRNQLESKPDVTQIVMDTAELDEATAQNDALQSEILELSSTVEELKDALDSRDKKIKRLNQDVTGVEAEIEKEREMTRKLGKKVEDLEAELEKNRDAWEKDVDRVKTSMQEDVAGEMQKQMDAQKAFIMGQEKLAKQAEKMELEKQRLLKEERERFERLLAKEREIAESHKRAAVDSKSTELTIEQQRNEIAILRSRLQKTQIMFEKKFAVLRSSLHALKDESYIRQQLQKQAATLKYASISYGNEIITPRQASAPPLNHNKPLPAIRGDSGKHPPLATDTLPSGPGTEIFTTGAVDSGDEQDMEEYARGFMPLPNPPVWQKSQFGEYMPSIDQIENF